MKQWTLHTISEQYGISRRAVQGYEQHGLVHPTGRNERGHLTYNQQALSRILQIRQLNQLGFPVSVIDRLLCAPPEVLRQQLTSRREALSEEADSIRANICLIDRLLEQL